MQRIAPQQVQRKQKKSFKPKQDPTSTTRKINKEKQCPKCIDDLTILTKLMQVRKNIPVKTDVTNVMPPYMWRDLDVQPVDIDARIATRLVISVAYATRKKSLNTRERVKKPRAHQLIVGRASMQNSLCCQSDASLS